MSVAQAPIAAASGLGKAVADGAAVAVAIAVAVAVGVAVGVVDWAVGGALVTGVAVGRAELAGVTLGPPEQPPKQRITTSADTNRRSAITIPSRKLQPFRVAARQSSDDNSAVNAPAPVSPLFVSQFGRGRPLLSLHGIEAHGLRFVALATRLDDVHVVAPDLRGHGHSPGSGPWTIAQHVADLAPILIELGPATVVLGHSYGGLIAWELARAMPDALRGLVLVDPAIGVSAATREEGMALSGTRVSWADERRALDDLLSQREPGAWWAAAL